MKEKVHEDDRMPVWPIKVPITIFMYTNDEITLWLPDLQDKKLLTLHWQSFLEDSSYVIASVSAH